MQLHSLPVRTLLVFPGVSGNTSARTAPNVRGPPACNGAYRASGGLAMMAMWPLTRCVGSASHTKQCGLGRNDPVHNRTTYGSLHCMLLS